MIYCFVNFVGECLWVFIVIEGSVIEFYDGYCLFDWDGICSFLFYFIFLYIYGVCFYGVW